MHRFLVVPVLALSASVMAAPSHGSLARADRGDPVASSFEGLPIPEVAVIDPDLSGGASETYHLPDGTKAKALRRWYKEELPIGQAFGDWSWCESVKSRNFLQRTWTQGDTFLVLLLRYFDRSAPPVILVGTYEGGSC